MESTVKLLPWFTRKLFIADSVSGTLHGFVQNDYGIQNESSKRKQSRKATEDSFASSSSSQFSQISHFGCLSPVIGFHCKLH